MRYEDVFNRASDPLLSSMHLAKRIYITNKQNFPPEVVALLEAPSVPLKDEYPTTSRPALEELELVTIWTTFLTTRSN